MEYAYTKEKGFTFGTVAQVDDLMSQGVTEDEAQDVIDDYNAWKSERQAKANIRQKIYENAGDEASLLSTTSDAASLAIFGLASLVAKLSTAQSLAEVREAAAPFAAFSAGFLAKINTENPTEGEVVLPFMLKGLDSVVADIETRATAVSAALQSAQKG